MILRFSRLLKCLVILLFTVELLIPAFLSVGYHAQYTHPLMLTVTPDHADLPGLLFFEESENEEKSGKHNSFPEVRFIEVYNNLEKFRPSIVTWRLPNESANSQPSLFTLYEVFLI